MLVTPIVSDKSYKLASQNVYVFKVPLNANKAEVIAAIESENKDVKVKDVRLMIAKGKVKAVNRGKRSRPGKASRKDVKKAYVTLADGKIEIAAFEDIDNQVKSQAAEAEKAQAEVKQAENVEAKKAAKITKRRTGRRGDR